MILNIHGYDSSGKNSKYEFLASEYKDQLLISPSFDYSNENPYNILDTLRNRIILNHEKDKKNVVVGSSIGGFFAYCLCAAYEIKTIPSGGRVLTVVGIADTLQEARDVAYSRIETVQFEKMHYRNDIGDKSLKGVK